MRSLRCAEVACVLAWPPAQEGLALADDGDADGVRRFWFPALVAQQAAAAAAEPLAETAAAPG